MGGWGRAMICVACMHPESAVRPPPLPSHTLPRTRSAGQSLTRHRPRQGAVRKDWKVGRCSSVVRCWVQELGAHTGVGRAEDGGGLWACRAGQGLLHNSLLRPSRAIAHTHTHTRTHTLTSRRRSRLLAPDAKLSQAALRADVTRQCGGTGPGGVGDGG